MSKNDTKEFAALMDAYTSVGKTSTGRRVLWDVLSIGGIFTASVDPTTAQFYNGKRAAALEVLEQMNEADPSIFIMMLKENQERING